jgi:hypothetical protein
MVDADVEGGCLCGAIRYRVQGTPVALSRCHCRSCRLATGSAGVAWTILERTQFTLLLGELTRYRSSADAVRGFCGRCGASISYEPDDAPQTIEITSATLDEPARFAPTREVWLSHALVWEPLNPTLPRFDQGSGA